MRRGTVKLALFDALGENRTHILSFGGLRAIRCTTSAAIEPNHYSNAILRQFLKYHCAILVTKTNLIVNQMIYD